MKRLIDAIRVWVMLLPVLMLTMCSINGDGAPVSVSDIVVPASVQRGPIPIEFTLTASEATTGIIKIQYRVAENDPWRACTALGRNILDDGLSASVDGTVHRFIWDIDADLNKPDDTGEVGEISEIAPAIRIAADSNAVQSETFAVILGNQPPILSFSRIPDANIMGSSELAVNVYDAENDPVTITLLWSRGTDEPTMITSFVVNDSYAESYTTDANGELKIAIPWIDVFGDGGEYRQVNFALHSSDPYGPGEKLVHRNMTVDIPLDVSIACTMLPVTQRGMLTIPCTVYGPPYQYYTLKTLFRDPYHPEQDWQAATVRQGSEYFLASPNGVEMDITWDSASDLSDMIYAAVQVEVRLQPLGLRTLMSVALNNAPKIISMALSEVYIEPGNSFIELYGHPGFNLEGYAVVEVYKNGTYNLSKTAGFVQFPEDSIIPDDGFMVIGENEDIPNVDIVDPAVATYFKFGFPTNLIMIEPLDQREYYDRDKVKVVDAVALGTFTAANVFDGLCDFTQRRAEEQGIEDLPCPFTAAAPQPEEGQSACRIFSNLDLGENNLDWGVCATPSPGEGVLADTLQ